MGIKEYRATGGNRALLNDYHRKSDSLAQWQINFLPDTATQIYGFDYLGSGNHGIYSGSEYYPYLSGNYDLRFKSVECGKTDKVIVDFGSYPERDSVVFKDKWGVKLKVSKDNILNFSGVTDADTNYIYAYRGDQKLGKLSVNTYKKKSYKVVLVSVNGAKLPDISKVIDCLHKVYKQAVDTFEIKTDTLTVNGLDKFSHGGSGVLTVYNDDQKTVLRAYDSEMKNGVYYLFFIDNVTDKKDGNGTMVSGYMPRGYNAGFIYDGGSPHTIAHELGHGIAGLEHVFENSKSSGKTKNLMDYSSGEELWHFQWDEIQDPSRVWMKWNKDEEEGELVNGIPRTEWVLIIYSPWVSDAFYEAYTKEDYYGMRKWTYKALNQQFKDEHLGWYSKQSFEYKDIFANEDKKVAKLIHYNGAKQGVTVIMSKYNDQKRIVFNNQPLYFPPYEGNFYINTALMLGNLIDPNLAKLDFRKPHLQSLLSSFLMGPLYTAPLKWVFNSSSQEQLRKLGLDGLFYPVDVFLYDEKTKKCDGNNFYGPLDFIGVQAAFSVVAGYNNKNSILDDFLKLFNLNYSESGTLTIGRLRGYGICAYSASLQNGGGLDVGVALALVSAKYNGSKSDNDYWDINYSPQKFAGKAVNFSLGYSFISLDFFKAYDIRENGLEYNNFSGGEIEFTLGPSDLSGSASFYSEQSELIDLNKYLKK